MAPPNRRAVFRAPMFAEWHFGHRGFTFTTASFHSDSGVRSGTGGFLHPVFDVPADAGHPETAGQEEESKND